MTWGWRARVARSFWSSRESTPRGSLVPKISEYCKSEHLSSETFWAPWIVLCSWQSVQWWNSGLSRPIVDWFCYLNWNFWINACLSMPGLKFDVVWKSGTYKHYIDRPRQAVRNGQPKQEIWVKFTNVKEKLSNWRLRNRAQTWYVPGMRRYGMESEKYTFLPL